MEEQQVFRYVSGLKSEIREAIYLHTINNVTEAVALAQKMELQPKTSTRNQSSYRSGGNYKAAIESTTDKSAATQSASHNSAVAKGITIESSTPHVQTSTRGNNPYAKPMGDKCWRCGQQGHLSNTCPRRRQTALMDGDKNKDMEVESGESRDDEPPIDYADGVDKDEE
ncbi:zinc finger protein [Macleaya cordata]|uniref:Zinc finger protein n=1 Tax=Macleaya cordata TaxID=56857 RepID=A0A200Q2M6_MACCD|nr:zinc finger protein [Macleaya cordata]